MKNRARGACFKSKPQFLVILASPAETRLAEFDPHKPQVTNFVDPLKLSPFLSYPTEVFCYTQSCGTVAVDFHCKRDLSPFSERGSSSQYEKSPFGIGTALGLPGQN